AGSSSGTFVDGQKIASAQELKPGDVIQIGTTQMRLQRTDTAEATTQVGSAIPGAKAASDATGQLAELIGRTLSHYRIDAVLARAQAGMVFRAHDTDKDQTVALKVLWPEFSKNDEEMHRFVRAIKTMLPLH